jgi:hypothetical protein
MSRRLTVRVPGGMRPLMGGPTTNRHHSTLFPFAFDEFAGVVFGVVEDRVGYVILPFVEDLLTHVKHLPKLRKVRLVALAVILQVFDGFRAV